MTRLNFSSLRGTALAIGPACYFAFVAWQSSPDEFIVWRIIGAGVVGATCQLAAMLVFALASSYTVAASDGTLDHRSPASESYLDALQARLGEGYAGAGYVAVATHWFVGRVAN